MNKEYFTATEIAEALGMSKAGVLKKADRESWQWQKRKGKGGGKEYHINSLPISAQTALILSEEKQAKPEVNSKQTSRTEDEVAFTYEPNSLWAYFESKPDKQKQVAQAKLDAFIKIIQLHDQMEVPLREAIKLVSEQVQWSFSTLRDIYYGKPGKPGLVNYKRQDWLAALVPGYTGKRESSELSIEAWDFIKADYLRPEAPMLKPCYNRLTRAAEQHGWKVPSYNVVRRRINKIPATIRVLKREGESALVRLYPPLERTVRDLRANQWINGDGYMHNVFVRLPDDRIVRLKTWFWQDIYSRKILAWRTDETEHTDVIRLSFGDLVEKYGIPEHATIDNTRAAANKWMTGGVPNRYRFKVKEDDPMGLFPMLGVQVHWTSVIAGKGHGQAKPIERSFGVGGLGEYVDKHPDFSGAYTGANVNAKPENYASTAVPYDKFIKTLEAEIHAWNAMVGRKTEMAYGQYSFDQVFESSFQNSHPRMITAEQRRLFLMSAEAVKVSQNGTITLEVGSGVGLGRNRYAADELLEMRGHKVVVRFDPDNLHGLVYVYTLDGRMVCEAECMEAVGFGDRNAGREFNKLRRSNIKATKQIAENEVRMDIMEVSRLMPESPEPQETPKPKVVKPHFGDLKVVNMNIEDDEKPNEHEQNFIEMMEAMK